MSDFKILYPDIPSRAVTWMSQGANPGDRPNETDFEPALNCFRGNKSQYWRSSYTHATQSVIYDLGSSQTVAVDFLALARVDLIERTYATEARIYSSTDDSTYTAQSSALAIAPSYGARLEDYVSSLSLSFTARYVKVQFTLASAQQLLASKIYLGQAFDLEGDIDDYTITQEASLNDEFISSSQSVYPARMFDPVYTVSITWVGVTDAKVKTFFDTIYARRRHTPVFLWAAGDNAKVLNSHTLLFCTVVDATLDNSGGKADWNILRVTFRENT